MLMQRLSLLAARGRTRMIYKTQLLQDFVHVAQCFQIYMMQCCHLVPTEENKSPETKCPAHQSQEFPTKNIHQGAAVLILHEGGCHLSEDNARVCTHLSKPF